MRTRNCIHEPSGWLEGLEGNQMDEIQIEELSRHQAFLHRLAYDLVGDSATAEDVVQETWIAFSRRSPGDISEPRSWLAGVVRNLARRHFRSSKRRARHEANATDPARLTVPKDVLAQEELRSQLVAAVSSLDEPYASTLFHRYWDELAVAEIARLGSLSVETVKTRLRRGLVLLRQKLDCEFGDREAWMAAFVPISSPPPALPASPPTIPAPKLPTPSGASWMLHLLSGGLLMSVPKVVVTLTLVTGLACLWFFGRTPEGPESGSESEAVVSSKLGERDVGGTREETPQPAADLVAGFRIRLLDRRGHAPIELASVTLLDESLESDEWTGVSDSNGVVTGPKSEARRVSIRAPGYVPIEVPHLHSPDERTLTLIPGDTWRGRIVDTEGRPVPGARIDQPLDPKLYGPLQYIYVAKRFVGFHADADGAFETAVRNPATHLAVSAPGYVPRWIARPELRSPVVLTATETVMITVFDENHVPVDGADVEVMVSALGPFEDRTELQTKITGTTGPSGRVQLGFGESGAVRLRVDHPSYDTMLFETRPWLPSSQGVFRVESLPRSVELRSRVTLRGKIVDQDGLPVVDAVRYRASGHEVSLEVAADGSFADFQPFGRAGEIVASGFLPKSIDGSSRVGAVDLGVIRLRRDRTLAVLVQDESGEPVPGVELLIAAANVSIDGDRSPPIVTDLDGGARRTGLSTYQVTVGWNAPGFVSGKASLALVDRETTATITIAREAFMEGTVVGSDGVPLSGAEIRWEHGDGSSTSELSWSSEDGGFLIGVLAGESVRLFVSAAGYNTTVVDCPACPGAEVCKVDPIRLTAGIRVFGTVTSSLGSPLPGATISVDRKATPTTSGAAGEYEAFASSDSGRVYVRCRPSGWVTTSSGSRELTIQGPISETETEYRADFRVPDLVDYTLRVVDHLGRPIPECDVGLVAPRDLKNPIHVQYRDSIQTDAQGEATFRGVPDQSLSLQVGRLITADFGATSASGLPGEVQIDPRCRWIVRLEPLLPEEESMTSLPAEARYQLNARRGPGSFMSQGFAPIEDGRLTLAGLTAGRYTLTLNVPGFAPVVHEAEIEGEVFEESLELTPNLNGLLVRVVDTTGQSIENATVQVSVQLGRSRQLSTPARTDDSGRARIEAAPSHAMFEVTAAGFAAQTVENAFSNPDDDEVTVELTRPSTLRVSVREANGSLAQDVIVGFRALTPGVPMELTMGTLGRDRDAIPVAKGEAVIEDLVAARYRVMLTRSGVEVGRVEVDVRAETDEFVEVGLEERITVAGHIERNGGRVDGGTIRVGRVRAVVQADGSFELAVPIGPQRYSYTAPDDKTVVWYRSLGETSTIQLSFDEFAARGILLDPDGEPVSNFQFRLWGPSHYSVTTGPDGTFEIEHAVEGEYTASIDRQRVPREVPYTEVAFTGQRHWVRPDNPLELRLVQGHFVALEVDTAESERGWNPQVFAQSLDGIWSKLQRYGEGLWAPEGTRLVQVFTSVHAPTIASIDWETRRLGVSLRSPGGRVSLTVSQPGTLEVSATAGTPPLVALLQSRRLRNGAATVSLPVGTYDLTWSPDAGEQRRTRVVIGPGSIVKARLD